MFVLIKEAFPQTIGRLHKKQRLRPRAQKVSQGEGSTHKMNVLWMLWISWWYCGVTGAQPRPVSKQSRFTEHANTRREEEQISPSIWDLARIQISGAFEEPCLPVENN